AVSAREKMVFAACVWVRGRKFGVAKSADESHYAAGHPYRNKHPLAVNTASDDGRCPKDADSDDQANHYRDGVGDRELCLGLCRRARGHAVRSSGLRASRRARREFTMDIPAASTTGHNPAGTMRQPKSSALYGEGFGKRR